ncbi:MAG: cyclic nucleotide-binding domain-containing protein [Myxococcales bacterium]|nr:cyclic nucleotide-binding domain-containing protein [Myxococcales bacterium]
MNRDQVEAAVGAYLKQEFGRVLVVRKLALVHHATHQAWAIDVVAPLRDGDVFIARLEVDEQGVLSPLLDVEGTLDVIRSGPIIGYTDEAEPVPHSVRPGSLDLDEPAPESVPTDDAAVRARLRKAISLGDRASLEQARTLYPRLLREPDGRGRVLLGMASVEHRLGAERLAIEYLEAATRELSDRFDVPALEDAASLALEILGRERYLASSIHSLLERSRARLQPLSSVLEAPLLAGVGLGSDRDWLAKNAELVTLARGEVLVRQGDASRAVFVIKSGLLAVLLDRPEGGGQRFVRCCFPGAFLGEASVLVEHPLCSATLRAERVTEVYRIEAALLHNLMERNEALRTRLASSRQIHRIDSFFATHEAMGQLDALVRDEVLACIDRIQTFDEDVVIGRAGDVPQFGSLVARGEVTLHDATDAQVGTVEIDGFFGVRDAIHGIPASLTSVAREGTTVAFFHADKLRDLAQSSPEHVTAVLERLG